MQTEMRAESYLNSEKPLAVVASSTGAHGYDLAKKFAENGYDIIVAASNPSIVEEAEEFKGYGVDAVSFQLDLSTAEGVEQLYTKIIATGRPVEAMIINTGLSSDGEIETTLAKKVLKDMSDRGFGEILFAGSEFNEDPSEITESMQADAEGTGVTLTSIKAGSSEVYFLKQGYEKPYLLQ